MIWLAIYIVWFMGVLVHVAEKREKDLDRLGITLTAGVFTALTWAVYFIGRTGLTAIIEAWRSI